MIFKREREREREKEKERKRERLKLRIPKVTVSILDLVRAELRISALLPWDQ